MAEAPAGVGATRHREGFAKSAMAMAGWHASMPPYGKRALGDSDRFADQTDGASAALRLSGTLSCTSRVHQENARNSCGRLGVGATTAKGVGEMSKKHMGTSIDDFLKKEGIFEEAQAEAIKEVIAWQLGEAMKERKISKRKMAEMLKTSRSQVDRLLDPKDDVTLSSLQRAAAMVGRRVSIELV